MQPVGLAAVAGKVGQRPAGRTHGRSDQFPANARDDLFAPGIEEAGESNAAGCHGSTQMGAPFND